MGFTGAWGILILVEIFSGHDASVPSLLGNAALGRSTAFVVATGQSGLITCLKCVTWLCRFGSGGAELNGVVGFG